MPNRFITKRPIETRRGGGGGRKGRGDGEEGKEKERRQDEGKEDVQLIMILLGNSISSPSPTDLRHKHSLTWNNKEDGAENYSCHTCVDQQGNNLQNIVKYLQKKTKTIIFFVRAEHNTGVILLWGGRRMVSGRVWRGQTPGPALPGGLCTLVPRDWDHRAPPGSHFHAGRPRHPAVCRRKEQLNKQSG